MSAQTARLAVTPAPAGKPDGPGLWDVKGMQLSPYFQNIRNALIRSGKTPADAYRITWGAIRRWARGGGKVHPEVVAAAQAALADLAAKSARAHSHSNERGAVTAVDLAVPFNSALHPRVAAGASNGGQFGSAAASSSKPPPKPAAKKAPAKQAKPAPKKPVPAKKPPAKPMAKPVPKPSVSAAELKANRAKAAQLHAQAQADRAKAKGLLQQVSALNKQITANQQTAAKAAAAAKAKAKKPGAAPGKAVAKKAPAKTAKKKTAAKKRTTTAQLKAKRTQLRTQAAGLMAKAKALDAQASHLKLANDAAAVELAMPMRTARVRGPGDVSCQRTGPGEITVTHKPTGRKIGTLKAAQHGGWQGTHATGKPSPASGSMAGALSGLIGLHNKVAASMPSAEPVGAVHAMAAHEAAMELAGSFTCPACGQAGGDGLDHRLDAQFDRLMAGAAALGLATPAVSASDGPRVTTMGGALNATAKAAKAKAAVPDEVQKVYRKLIAKGMKPAQAMALAKRAASMHAKATAKAA